MNVRLLFLGLWLMSGIRMCPMERDITSGQKQTQKRVFELNGDETVRASKMKKIKKLKKQNKKIKLTKRSLNRRMQ